MHGPKVCPCCLNPDTHEITPVCHPENPTTVEHEVMQDILWEELGCSACGQIWTNHYRIYEQDIPGEADPKVIAELVRNEQS